MVSPTGVEVEATAHPLRDDRLELGRPFLPDAVTGLENIQACMRQPFPQERRVSSESVRVVPTDHDGHGYVDRRKAGRQCCQIFRVRAHECRRPRQPIAFIGREIVVADEGWHGVAANRPQEAAYDLDGIERRQGLGFDHPLEGTVNIEWVHRGAGTHDEAAEEFWPYERGEEDRRRSDVESNSVDRREPERIDRLHDELAHLLRCEEIVARLRPPEAGKVDRQNLKLFCQPVPHRSEREDALRPWTEEHNLLATLPSRGVAHFEAIDRPPRDVEAW